MLYFCSPFSFKKDIGEAYNNYVKLIPDEEDWICITDMDTMFLTPDIGFQLQEIIDLHGNSSVGLFSCLTNRVGNLDQCYQRIISEDPNITSHRKIAVQLAKEKRHEIREIPNPISGHLMLFKKSTWTSIGGFPEGRGILSVDNTFSNRMARNGFKIVCMDGVYLFHYYRFCEGIKDKSHLK